MKSTVSRIVRPEGDALHASSWRRACSDVDGCSFQMRRFVTTLRNS